MLQLDWLAQLEGACVVGVSNKVFLTNEKRLRMDAVVNVRGRVHAPGVRVHASADPSSGGEEGGGGRGRGLGRRCRRQLETGTIEVTDAQLASALVLTASDRQFMAEAMAAVAADDDGAAGSGDVEAQIRGRFEDYVLRLLGTVVTVDQAIGVLRAPPTPADAEAAEQTIAAACLDDFQYRWLARWRTTPSYRAWRARFDHGELAAFEPAKHVGHPAHVDDFSARLLRCVRGGGAGMGGYVGCG